MDNRSQASTVVLAVPPRTLPGWVTPVSYGVFSLVAIGAVAALMPNFGVAAIGGGIAAFVVAAGAIVLLVMDHTPGSRLLWGALSALLIVVALVGVLGSGAGYQFAISRAEAQGNYGAAIGELQATGQKPPYSSSLADAYLNWGKAEIQQHAFAGAVTHLTYCAQNFPTLPEAAQASAMLPGVHLSWAQFATQNNDPVTAGQQYQILLTQYATSPEAGQAHDSMATAFLAWGDAEQKAGYYDIAYAAYQLVLTDFAKTPQATQAHASAATTLLAWATALTQAHRYGEAAIHYTDLAKNYADTPEGKKAISILAKGVQLVGRLFRKNGTSPVIPYTTVRLSSAWTVSGSGSSFTYSVSGQQYYADTDGHGYFDFPSVPPGQYLLEWRNTNGLFETLFNNNKPLELVTLRPLQALLLPPIVTNE
jgi:tetratricopeptide (TPR) repeat protein